MHRNYNPKDNSISIARGDVYSFVSGYRFSIHSNYVDCSGYNGKSDYENMEADYYKMSLVYCWAIYFKTKSRQGVSKFLL